MPNQVVGTAYVRLRLLTDSIGKDIQSAVKKQKFQDLDVHVKADTAEADAKLAATGAEADALGAKSPTIKPKVDSKGAEKNLGLLSTAIALLAPTLGPLAAAGVAAGAGIAAGAGVALLAVRGVKLEMKEGTQVGEVYSAGLQSLKGDLDVLSKTAARGVLGGFNTAVQEIHAVLPGVNQTVERLSVIMGQMGSRVIVGLVDGLITFEPVLQHVAVLADKGALAFAQWATGPGGAGFGSKLSATLDQVLPPLEELVKAIARLITAAGPLGGTVISSFGLLARLILSLPLPVLQTLIIGIVTLKTALTGLAIVDKLGNSFGDFGKKLDKAGIGSAAGKFTALGAAGVLAGAAMFGLSTIMSENAAHAQAVAKATQDYVQALTDSHGAITAAITDLTLQNAITDGTAQALAQAGISTQKWVDAVQNGGPALTELTTQLRGNLGPSHLLFESLIEQRNAFVNAQHEVKVYTDAQNEANRALSAANPQLAAQAKALGLTATAYQTAQTALLKKTETDQKNLDLQKIEIDQNYQLMGTQKILADMYGITTAQVQSYAAVLGITQQQVQEGLVSAGVYDRAVRTVADAFNVASQSGTAFLTALQQFSTSTGDAASRAQLLGAYLKAVQGDLLLYQGAVAGAYDANRNLIKSFDAAQKKSIDLKTGMIDVTKEGAGPLIQGLQAMQDAAMAAATATYQHEVATKGAGKAASDAATIFKTETYDALVGDAKQLGITSDQAKKLADRYFAMPKDIATRVRAIGTDPVVSVLNHIGQQLAFLTGHAWNPTVRLNDLASGNIQDLENQLNRLNGKVSTVVINTINKNIAMQSKAGGGGVQDGFFTVGEQGWELGYKQGSQVTIYPNSMAQQMAGVGAVPGYATGTAAGPTASQLRSARNTALTLRITIDQKDLYNLQKALAGTAQQISDKLHTLYLDLQKAANFQPGRHGQWVILDQIARDNSRLITLARQRDAYTAQLKAANQRLGDLQKAAAQERATVAGAVTGGFNITSSGQFTVGGKQYSSVQGILADVRLQVANAKRFADQLAQLRARGLSASLLQQIGEAGYVQGGASAAALSHATRAQLAALNASYAQLGAQGRRAGTTVANALFGRQLAAQEALVRSLERRRAEAQSQMNHLVAVIERLARTLANRPVTLTANGRELAKLVNDQNRALARR